ncbi:MAG TPA: helix-turn-helix transcriptional regulator [Streptosporangiaceae bacterium]|nr:helix-turn-helix transcriptional regulator [Streptosporangiaceae bacterium]
METVRTRPGLYRDEFVTDDLAEAREFLDRTYRSRLLTADVPAGSRVLAVSHTETRAFAVSDVALPAHLTFAADPSDQVIISTVLQGTVQVERGQDIDRYQAGDVLLGVRHIGPTVRTRGLRNRNVILPLPLLHVMAGTEPGTSAPLRFLSLHLASPSARAQWSAVTRYVDDLLASPDAALSPLVVTSAARLLAATALTVFPSTAHVPASPRDRRDASTATVRRAAAFIDEHAARDITVPDIAAAACVTVRALQMAFRRELDSTPTAYLRKVRLARAHRELVDADLSQETVTAVAYRWGFSSASRFSAYYRETYGVSPKQTLEYR